MEDNMSRNRYPSPDTDKVDAALLSALRRTEIGINGIVNSKTRPEASEALNHIRRASTSLREARAALKELRENEKRLRAAVAHWHEKAKERAV
jgi:signal transduction histidine kinase